MSSNMKRDKKPTGAVYPERAIDGTGIYAELEPLIDGATMAHTYLFGIPLISPLTKEKVTAKDLDAFVKRGMARFQMNAKTTVQTKMVRHRLPFDPELYKQYIALEIPFKPIRRVHRVAICSAAYGKQIDWGFNDPASGLNETDILGFDDSINTQMHQNNWHAQTAYGLGAIVTWNGLSYTSVKPANANNQPDTSPTFWSVAVWDGEWSAVTTYQIGAIVKYAGNKYVSQQVGNINHVPNSQPTWWAVATHKPVTDPRFPSGSEIYRLPPEWIEMGNATRGLLNVVPLGIIFSGGGLGFESQAGSLTGSALLQVIGAHGWLPAFWTVECETGWMDEEGQVPVIVNEAIGCASALIAIDVLLPLFRVASQSMSVDSLSQSVTDRIIDVLEKRQDTLTERYKDIVKHIKTATGNNFWASNV